MGWPCLGCVPHAGATWGPSRPAWLSSQDPSWVVFKVRPIRLAGELSPGRSRSWGLQLQHPPGHPQVQEPGATS